MKKISIKDLTAATGLSRATIDRALNGRGSVHPRTREAIDAALEHLRSSGVPAAASDAPLDIVLRVGRGMMVQVANTLRTLDRPAITLHDMYQRDDAEILDLVRALCADASRPLILCAKNAEPLRAELAVARARGKRVVTFISDLPHDARDAFVSIDNRMAGECAAFLLGSQFREREARFAVVIGDYAFSCHEEREMGFRAHLRAHFPRISIVHEAQGEDFYEGTLRAATEMVAAHPRLDAVYNVAGGNAGLAEALRAVGRAGRTIVLVHDFNHVTTPLLRDGYVDYILAQDTPAMLLRALRLAALPSLATEETIHYVDFGAYTRFNIPGFAPPNGQG